MISGKTQIRPRVVTFFFFFTSLTSWTSRATNLAQLGSEVFSISDKCARVTSCLCELYIATAWNDGACSPREQFWWWEWNLYTVGQKEAMEEAMVSVMDSFPRLARDFSKLVQKMALFYEDI